MNKIYTLGPQFSYSYNLCSKASLDREIVCVDHIRDVFTKIVQDDDAIGIVPIENMLGGTVRESLLALNEYAVCIDAAYDFHITHVLASHAENFVKVMSHAQPIMQCSDFLRAHKYDTIEASSTSEAMHCAAKDHEIAAIGSKEAAVHYGVPVVEKEISNRACNITRFIAVRSSVKKCSVVGTKTSMIITPQEDRAGLLFEILSVFEIKSINLTKIESIPTGNKMNDYIFYLDIDGALSEKRVADAIIFLRTFVAVDVFGSYAISEY